MFGRGPAHSALVLLLASAAAGACTFDASGAEGAGVPGGDGSGSSGPDAAPPPDAVVFEPCAADGEVGLPFEPRYIDRCVPAPERDFSVNPGERWRIDTDEETWTNTSGISIPASLEATDSIPQDEGPDILVVSFQELRVGEGATLYARGSRALAIATTDGIVVEEGAFLLGVGWQSGAGPVRGPGGDAPWCDGGGAGAEGAMQVYDESPGGSGGGGGGLGARGGAGAPVSGSDGDPVPGGEAVSGEGGSALLGGCSGGDGYRVNGSGVDSLGGAAGGALALATAGELESSGTISVSGGGGYAGADNSGGGGGGSGGRLVLEAAELDLAGPLTANGGGGGTGMRAVGGPCAPADGESGPLQTAEPASGGTIDDCQSAGDGGAGGAAAAALAGVDGEEGNSGLTGGAGPAPAGGGGGGGGAGLITVAGCDEPELGALTSPDAETARLACLSGS